MMRVQRWILAGLLVLSCVSARASVALLLEQPYGKHSLVDPTGHSAIYLDHVCAQTPLKLRTCREGELGAVISRYDDINGYDWIAVPLIPYLYAVESAGEIPLTIDKAEEMRLREAYRKASLQLVAPDDKDGVAPDNNWYELAGAAYDRTIFGFRVKTTAQQDESLIQMYNDRKNVQRYRWAFSNCADFARVVINRFYPHAVRRNFIADLGISTPKSVARSLAHYAKKHPETDFHVFAIEQVRGELPRSRGVENVAQSLLTRYGLPLVVLSPPAAAVVVAAFVGHGRFPMPKHAPPLEELTRSETAAALAKESSPPVETVVGPNMTQGVE